MCATRIAGVFALLVCTGAAVHDEYKVPEIATRGGAQTMYPEFRKAMGN
jgi:hypothetical protein